MKKLLSLLLIICSIGVAYADDKSTVTSLKYVTDELNTRQDKFGANDGKAMTFTNVAGGNLPRDVKASLGTSTSDNGLPTVSAVNTGLENKQDEIGAANTNTVVTYTGTPGTLGQKGIYQDTGTYAAQSDNLIQASTFNAALRNGLNNEFVCADRDPVSNQCWLWSIDNAYTENYVSATGTGVQDGTPSPTNPIYPIFYQQGDMILRKVGDYADSYDATTHKITRNIGVKVLDGTESWETTAQSTVYRWPSSVPFSLPNISICSHYVGVTSNKPIAEMPDMSAKTGSSNASYLYIKDSSFSNNLSGFKQWLADQYAAGTPVTVYYPLETLVEEDWPDTTYNTNVYIPQNQ
jgi:hypothetical protein